MPSFNRLKIFQRFEIYQLLKLHSARKASKMLKINRNTINKIKRNGFFKGDKLALKLYIIKEKFPYSNLFEIQKIYYKTYSKLISIETIRNKLSKYGIYKRKLNYELENFLEFLIDSGYFKEARYILKFYKPCNLEILKKMPEKFIPLYLIPEKLNLEIELSSVSYQTILEKVNKYLEITKKRNYNLTYLKLIGLKITLLLYLNKDQEAYLLYLKYKKDILKLPKSVKTFILYRFLFFVFINPAISKQTFNVLKRYSNEPDIKSALIKTLRNLGLINISKQLSEGHFYDYFCSFDFKHFFKFSKYPFKDPENRILYNIFKFIAIIMSERKFENLYHLKKEIEEEFQKMNWKIYEHFYYFAMGLFHMYHGEIAKAREFLDNAKTGNIILNKCLNKLSKFRKQDLVLKYLMKGNIKLAVEIAKRYNIIASLNIYSLLLNKSYHKIKRYKELKYTAKLLKKNNKIKFYFLRYYPTVYVNKTKYKIHKFSKSWTLLAYLVLNEGKARIDMLYWIKNVKHAVYFINKKFKTQLLSVHNQEVRINGEFESDIEKFIRFSKQSKIKALMLWRAEPFRRICYYYNWAEDIRDMCKMKREELLNHYNFNALIQKNPPSL
jgi:hypothetical protein